MDERGESRPVPKTEGHESRKGSIKRGRISDPRNPVTNTGLFSGVFSYVTAEVGSFITNATGGVITVDTGTTLDRVKHAGQDPEMRRRKKKRTREWTESVDRELTPDQRSRISEDRSRGSASTSDHEPKAETKFRKPELPGRLKTTMPGSLFPRSPSLMPSEAGHFDENNAEVGNERQVGWDFGLDENEASSSTGHLSQLSPKSPFRLPLAPSVKDAVAKFHADPDVDSSILLPSPPRSKGKEKEIIDVDAEDGWLVPPPRSIRHGPSGSHISREIHIKGKERELSEAIEEHNHKEIRWERDRDKKTVTGEEGDFTKEKEHDKERIRKLEEEIERLKEELRRRPASFSAFPPVPPAPPPPPLALSITAPSALKTNEVPAPFAHARSALKHAPTPKEAPINPPRRGGQPTVGITADKMAAFLNEMKTVRLKKVGSHSSLGKSISDISRISNDNSRRDSISDVERSRLSISDLRTTREISGIRTQDDPSSALARELNWPSTRSVNSNARGDASPPLHRKRKRTKSVDDFVEEIEHGTSGDLSSQIQKLRESIKNRKRTLNTSSIKVRPTSTSQSEYPYRPFTPPGIVPSQTISAASQGPSEPTSSLPQGTDFPSRVWSSISTESCSTSDPHQHNAFASSSASVPADTPSLCSDNDVERPGHDIDSSTPPSTPPGISARFTTPPKFAEGLIDLEVDLVDEDEEREDGPSVISGTLQKQPKRRSSPHPSAYLATKRIPASPLPQVSPQRPKPPASTKRRTSGSRAALHLKPPISRDSEHRDDEEEVDPLLLRDEDVLVSPSGVPQYRHRPRRSTLDEEMRTAHKASLIADMEDEYGEDEPESSMFVGTGLRSNNLGFLAHGGAGGHPVWMGEGYVRGVDGAEKEDQREEHQSFANGRETERNGSSGPIRSRTRIPVPKPKPPMVMRGR